MRDVRDRAVTWELHHHDARRVSELLEPESVDLIVTSPPYFALRSYQDGGEHYDGQLGSEATPTEFLDALIECTRDWTTVLRPGGSMFVNLGDKYAGSAGWAVGAATAASSTLNGQSQQARVGMTDRPVDRTKGFPAKSRMLLPHRYAIRCIDELGLIVRSDIVWAKPNGLPESVTDRVRASHEYIFHITKQPRYYAAIDEVREASEIVFTAPQNGTAHHARALAAAEGHHRYDERTNNPLGKVPGSVWTIPSEPLTVPDHLNIDHFAAYPSELPRRCILGWTPPGWCIECGEARRAVVDRRSVLDHASPGFSGAFRDSSEPDGNDRGMNGRKGVYFTEATITGYACACPNDDAPTTPAVVLDPFTGTGTTIAVAHLLGRHGIGTDLSHDYLRLARWRCGSDRGLRDKVLDRSGIPNPRPPRIDGQLGLFGDVL